MPCLRVAIIDIMEQDSARYKSLTKTTQALTALNLEVIIPGDKNECKTGLETDLIIEYWLSPHV